MAVQHHATKPVQESAPSELEALSSLAVTVLNEHTNDADPCAVCGSTWPCERVIPAEHFSRFRGTSGAMCTAIATETAADIMIMSGRGAR
jgi:hypothetical protein